MITFTLVLLLAAAVVVPTLAAKVNHPRKSLRVAVIGAGVLTLAAWGVALAASV